jgi:hypothetical protein
VFAAEEINNSNSQVDGSVTARPSAAAIHVGVLRRWIAALRSQ